MNCVQAERTSEDKNRKLLDLLTRKSVTDYKIFIECLEITKQSHIAQLLNTNSGQWSTT